MRWAYSTRQLPWALALAVVCGIPGTMYGSVNIELPFMINISSISPMIPASLIPSLILAIIVYWASVSGEERWMESSARNVLAHSYTSIALSVAATFLAGFMVSVIFNAGNDLGLLMRNLVALTFMATAARSVGFDRFSGIVPVLYVLLCCVFGRASSGNLQGWAWGLNRQPLDTWALGTIGIGLMLTVLHIWRRKPLLNLIQN